MQRGGDQHPMTRGRRLVAVRPPVFDDELLRASASPLKQLHPCASMPSPFDDSTWHYSLFAGDTFLYTGIARDLGRRLRQHRAQKTWWPEVDMGIASLHCCRRDAGQNETYVIVMEEPHFNLAYPNEGYEVPPPPHSELAFVMFGPDAAGQWGVW